MYWLFCEYLFVKALCFKQVTATLLVPLWIYVAGASYISLSFSLTPSFLYTLFVFHPSEPFLFIISPSIHTPSNSFFFIHSLTLSLHICWSINIIPLIICAYQHVPHACGMWDGKNIFGITFENSKYSVENTFVICCLLSKWVFFSVTFNWISVHFSKNFFSASCTYT